MFPPEFFNGDAASRTRGIEFNGNDEAASGGKGATGFQLSSTAASGQPIEFGFVESFQAFSPERLFAPTGGTVFDVLFFDPVDQKTPSVTDGFGAVFTNIVDNDSVYLSFYDQNDVFLVQEYARDSDAGGLSFLGASFDNSILSKVTISAGLSATGSPFANGENVVVMDACIFGEPIGVAPAPASVFLLLSAFVPLVVRNRRNIKTA
ncbi:hypothetical protein [Roseobacter sp.]|uniref:hypothetical protein n=1 Tax=Roseobacter sp. TaxID=1907202 RepID=UPI00385DF841